MKTLRIYLPITVSAFATMLALAASSASGQSLSPAYTTSPRVIEAFPWLARSGAQPKAATTASVPAIVTRNTAFAASPRALELYPQLGRPVPTLSKAAAPEIKNAAYAASPRAKEQFPWLTRGVQTFEVAPLK